MTQETRLQSGADEPKPSSSVVVSIPQTSATSQAAAANSRAAAAPAVPPARALRTRSPKTSALSLQLQKAVTQWVPLAQYQLARLGPAGVAGVSASAAAVVIGLFALLSLRTANDSLNVQILRARHHPEVTVTPEQGLLRAVAQLPTRAQIAAVLGQVLQQAQAAGVELEKGQYTYVASPAGGFGRYELDFPVKAQYPGVRDFINRTLTHIPAAGLDKLSFERKLVGDTQVSAEVRFVVFTRDR
ncbi:MAG: hypothetical protein ACJ8R9_29775 [Steroidobacteraceae bacterium]